MGEFDIIARYFAPLSLGEPGAFGLKNDAAILNNATGRQTVVTSDCLVAGVHFLDTDPPESVARKALGVNLSDLAAMGAQSRTYTLAAVWPNSIDESWIAAFADGLGSAQNDWGVTLIGGDTVATDGPLTLTITAFGEVEQGTALTRSGAQPGDDVYVSGTLGDAALGLLVSKGEFGEISKADADYLIDRYRRPQPRVTLGPELQGIATSAIDISDGLLADLGHIMYQSGTSAALQEPLIPLSSPARSLINGSHMLIDVILGGGDDYELLFTAPPSSKADIKNLSNSLSVAISPIGTIDRITGESPIQIVDIKGNPLTLPPSSGYQHL